MRNLKDMIVEDAGKKITFQGTVLTGISAQEYELNNYFLPKAKHDVKMNAAFNKLSDLDADDLKKQGVKWIVATPPQKSGIDYWTIKLFTNKKKMIEPWLKSEIYAIYDVNKKEIIDNPALNKRASRLS
jgi:hypothetical protein